MATCIYLFYTSNSHGIRLGETCTIIVTATSNWNVKSVKVPVLNVTVTWRGIKFNMSVLKMLPHLMSPFMSQWPLDIIPLLFADHRGALWRRGSDKYIDGHPDGSYCPIYIEDCWPAPGFGYEARCHELESCTKLGSWKSTFILSKCRYANYYTKHSWS